MKKSKPFTPEQIQELQSLIRNAESSKAEALRAQAALMINDGIGEEQIEKLIGFDGKYAYKLRKKYLEKGLPALIDKRKPKPRALLTRGQRAQIALMIRTTTPRDYGFDEDFWSTAILGRLIKEQYNVHYKSRTPLYLLFKEAIFTYHKPDGKYHKRDQKAVDLWKEYMEPKIQEAYADKDVVLLTADEMILTTQTTFQKIWLPRGEAPKIDISNKRARRCIYGFNNMKTGQQHAFKTERCNSDATCKCLEQIGQIYKDKKIVLVWDGASWHRSAMVKEFLKSGRFSFQLYRFPPYSPEENPQEHVWKAGRSVVTHNKFIENIDKATDDFVDYLNSTKFHYKFFNPGVIS
jgi:transposase